MEHAHLPVDTHLDALRAATERLARWSGEAGLQASVPPCPGWTVLDLVAHQGFVHRWARSALRGQGPSEVAEAATEAEGRGAADPLAWLRSGADELAQALVDAPDDVEAFTFLREAPAPRLFWARRQAHETAVHALDALAARDGRLLTAGDTWFGAAHALDGVDELLTGFWPRRGRGPRSHGPAYTALVAAGGSGDGGARWLVDVDDERVVTHRVAAGDDVPSGLRTLTGPPVDLYLALWNRGGDVSDPTGLLTAWHDGGAVV